MPEKTHRLQLVLPLSTMEKIKEIQEPYGSSMTFVVKRSVTVYNHLFKEIRDKGATLVLEYPDGTRTKLFI